ncbi:DUF3299 domain-containing protein [Vibrio astriarenae]
MKIYRLKLLTVMLLSWLSLPLFAFAQVTDLTWTELIPEHEHERYNLIMEAQSASMMMIDHNSDLAAKQIKFGSTREDLIDTNIRIQGFIIPLEGDFTLLREFLLVPFIGACIHVPPPPPNQMIYVKSEKGIAAQELWAGVAVTGTIKAETIDNELATIGYSMDLIDMEKL